MNTYDRAWNYVHLHDLRCEHNFKLVKWYETLWLFEFFSSFITEWNGNFFSVLSPVFHNPFRLLQSRLKIPQGIYYCFSSLFPKQPNHFDSTTKNLILSLQTKPFKFQHFHGSDYFHEHRENFNVTWVWK